VVENQLFGCSHSFIVKRSLEALELYTFGCLLLYTIESIFFCHALESLKLSMVAVEAGLMEAGTGVKVISDYMKQQQEVTDRTIDTVFLQLETTRDELGMTPTNLPARFTAPSLWGTVTTIIDYVVATVSDTLSRAS
jgi:hypothetical protein